MGRALGKCVRYRPAFRINSKTNWPIRSLALAIGVCDFRIVGCSIDRTSFRLGAENDCGCDLCLRLESSLFRLKPFGLAPIGFALPKENVLLTESTVEQMFRKLMNDPQRDEERFEKAEELIEVELRPESPLRHRLSVELDELRLLSTKT